MQMDSVIICHVMVEKNNSKRFLEPNFVIFTLYPEANILVDWFMVLEYTWSKLSRLLQSS